MTADLSLIRNCRDIFIWGSLQMWYTWWPYYQSVAWSFFIIWNLQDLHRWREKGEDLGVSRDKGQHSFCPQGFAVLAMVVTQELQLSFFAIRQIKPGLYRSHSSLSSNLLPAFLSTLPEILVPVKQSSKYLTGSGGTGAISQLQQHTSPLHWLNSEPTHPEVT